MKKIIIYFFLSFLILSCSNSKKNIKVKDTTDIEEKITLTKDAEISEIKETIVKEEITEEAPIKKALEVENKKESEISNHNKEVTKVKEVAVVKTEENITNSKPIEEEVKKPEPIIKESKISIDESLRTFVNKERKITGNWSLKQEGENIYIVFHSNFKTKSGPDLKVFISTQDISNTNGKNANKNALLLKDLSSNKGEQKYLIPSNIDLSQYKCVLIHCVKYAKLWGGGKL